MRYVDLFCGLGAFHQAFDRHGGFECVMACDIDEGVRKIYHENYGIVPLGDINEIADDQIPEFDVLTAGFPCQPFSIAGKKAGFDDMRRGNLFFRILEILDLRNPETVILENVKNLETINNGDTLKFIVEQLQQRGYHVVYKVLDSKKFRCPQSRKRIYIVGNKRVPDIEFPIESGDIVPVSSIIDHTVDDEFQFSDKYDLQPVSSGTMKYKLINKASGKGGRQGERVYSIDTYGPTICASSGGVGPKTGLYDVNGKIRGLTVSETLCMFGFPTDFKIPNTKKMLFYLGNSIVVNVVYDIISSLISQGLFEDGNATNI